MREKKERHNMSTETKTTVQPQAQAKERFGVRALSFYEIDFSEVPVMVGCFAMGPFAGALIEFVKILLNFVFTGTDTAGVGELANFIIGCALCVPAGLIYRRKRTRTTALVEMGTAVNPNINSLATFVIFAVAPFNLLKGVLVSLIVFVIYKKISPIFRMRLS